MKRDEFLGQDPERKIIFAFLFSRNQKAISLFWHSGVSVTDLKEVFENDPGLVNSGMEFWTEIVK